MSKPIEFTALALEDIGNAAEWYRKHDEDLMAQFLEEIENALGEIAKAPRRFPVVLNDCRRALIARFPYKVMFRERPRRISVLAVFHQSRNPESWMRRVDFGAEEE